MVTQGDFWRGRRVLVTGHTGFKGSWLTLWLHSIGAEVTGCALAPQTTPALWDQLALGTEVQSRIVDIRDLSVLTTTFREARPEVVFHLAAQSLVRASYDDPVGTYATNVLGTAHVLEAVRRTPEVCAVVNVTSDKCYENREWVWAYRENEPMGGRDPYSSSKGCAELVAAAYRDSFFGKGGHAARIGSARAGNVIGGGDWAADRLVPDFVRAVSRAESVMIRNPLATRPWQHVLEPLSGYLLLAERLASDGGQYAGGWNFGPADDDAVPVEKIINQLVSLWGKPAAWSRDPGEQPHEAHLLKLDSSKSRTLLRWRPRLSLQTALEWTVEWYKGAAGGMSPKDLTLQQIRNYEELGRP